MRGKSLEAYSDPSGVTIAPGISLSKTTMTDAPELFLLIEANREALGIWLHWVPLIQTLEDQKRFVELSETRYASTGALMATVRYQEKIAGVISFNSINATNRSGEIGYWLGQEFQGKGIMTLSCREFLGIGFELLGLNRISIHCAKPNIPSRKIPERLGMVFEGTIREGEIIQEIKYDLLCFGMLQSEWSTHPDF